MKTTIPLHWERRHFQQTEIFPSMVLYNQTEKLLQKIKDTALYFSYSFFSRIQSWRLNVTSVHNNTNTNNINKRNKQHQKKKQPIKHSENDVFGVSRAFMYFATNRNSHTFFPRFCPTQRSSFYETPATSNNLLAIQRSMLPFFHHLLLLFPLLILKVCSVVEKRFL